MPDHFRFSVKLPKDITHVRKLVACDDALDDFLRQAHSLAAKLSVLLVQLPPKHAFEATVAETFFRSLADRTSAEVACEPRHFSWFSQAADDCLKRLAIARVAADPALCPAAAIPGGSKTFSYWRLHGSPVMYRSSYEDRLEDYSQQLMAEDTDRDVWCIFDNTASSAGIGDALGLKSILAVAG